MTTEKRNIMTKQGKNRIKNLILLVSITSLSLYLILSSLSEKITFFFIPSNITIKEYNKIIRLGGIVKENSINKNKKSNEISFILKDNRNQIPILYKGISPPMFRESQGIIAKGKYDGKIFYADILLTKHDEQYKPI